MSSLLDLNRIFKLKVLHSLHPKVFNCMIRTRYFPANTTESIFAILINDDDDGGNNYNDNNNNNNISSEL